VDQRGDWRREIGAAVGAANRGSALRNGKIFQRGEFRMDADVKQQLREAMKRINELRGSL
jgi:tellurite resistance protein